MTTVSGAHSLPLPFYDDPWTGQAREAARALWRWHLSLWAAAHAAAAHPHAAGDWTEAAERVAAGEPDGVVPLEVYGAARAVCERRNMPVALLAGQVRAAAGLTGPVRFETAAALRDFAAAFAGAHGRLLGRLAGAAGAWQQPWIEELATGFFLVGRLLRLPSELERDWLFIPLEDLDRAGVSLEALRTGAHSEAVRRLLWKQVVRARDAFAQGRPLLDELEPRYARTLKRYWLGALEVLSEVERRGYDLWQAPPTLSRFRRLQVLMQARFGRSIFSR